MATQVPADAPGLAAGGSLRDRLRQAVRDTLAEQALALFLDRGFAETTVDDIAAASGASRSTFFRHFATKEDVVLGHLVALGQQTLAALRARPDDEPPWTALRAALSPGPAQTGGPLGLGLEVARLLIGTPSLQARHHEKTAAWQTLLTPEVARRLDLPADAPDPRPAALVLAALGCVHAATQSWVACDGTTDLGDLIASSMEAVGPRARPAGPG